jgi:hypothetical protein
LKYTVQKVLYIKTGKKAIYGRKTPANRGIKREAVEKPL